MNFTEEYSKRKSEFESYLSVYLNSLCDMPEQLTAAIKYCLLSGGKRLRPVLLLEAVKITGGKTDEIALTFALAVECIHTYSLIHDDLPCMDNDDFRRGKPTCHKQFGETLAVLCGDALLNCAYELMLGAVANCNNPAFAAAAKELAFAAGAKQMVGGQVYDTLYDGDADLIDKIYKQKTAALIRAALTAGALIGGANSQTVKALGEFGELFGYCFQLKDDLLDEGGEDKNTYLKLYGKQAASKRLGDKTAQAVNILKTVANSEFLQELSLNFIERAE